MKKLSICFLLLLPFGAFAQKDIEFGVFGGFANYQGDLVAPQIEFSETKFSYGAFMRYHLSEKLKFKLNGYFGFITGSDEKNKTSLRERGWSFESNLIEASGVLEFHPIGKARYGSTGIFQKQVSPYGYAGIGMVHADPTVTVSKPEDEGLFPEQGFTTPSVSIPFGAGVRIDVIESFSLGFEGGWRVTFNDYIDGVSTNGNSNKNDLYIFLGTTLSFVISGQADELEF